MNKYLAHIADQPEKNIFSIEINFQNENQFSIYLCHLIKNKKKIEFDCYSNTYSDFNELKPIIKKNQTLCLSITGKGIITKKIVKGDNFRFSLKLALPNINEDDFYYQIYDCESYLFITLIRKNQLDVILSKIKQESWFIDEIVLGELSAAPIASLIDIQEIQNHFSKIEFREQLPFQITAATEKNTSYVLDEKNITSKNTASLGVGLNYYLKTFSFNPIHSELFLEIRENLHYKRLLHKIGFGSLAIILVILLFNHFVQSHYTQQQLLLEEVLSTTDVERKQLTELRSELIKKRELVQSSGLTNSVKLSFYAHELGKEVPDEITLKDLFIYPLKLKKLEPGEKAEFLLGTIQIKGNTSNSEMLNSWVKKIKNYPWSKEVTIEQYNQTGPNPNADFTVNIKIT